MKKEWFVHKGESKYGPFTYHDVIRMLQERKLNDYDFIWKADMVSWTRIHNCVEFSPEKIRDLCDSQQSEVVDIFFRRRHPRAKYETEVLIHNCKAVWKGTGLEISLGG